MKLLLDTHIFLWALLEPERLSTAVANELELITNEIWLSPISVWETLILGSKGRVLLQPDLVTWIRKALRGLAPKEAPLTSEAAIRSRILNLPHSDPVDRFLAATAAVFDLTLVTVDELLVNGDGYRVLTG